jgi:hypothetical protein
MMKQKEFENLKAGDRVIVSMCKFAGHTGRVRDLDSEGDVHVTLDVDNLTRRFSLCSDLELLDVAEGSGAYGKGLSGDDLIQPGTTVILGKRRVLADWSTPWSTALDAYVGRRAQVMSVIDTGGPRRAEVDVDGGQYLWRVRDMTMLTPAFCEALEFLGYFSLESDPALGPRTRGDELGQAGLGELGQKTFVEWLVRADIAQWDVERFGYLGFDHARLVKACSTLAGDDGPIPSEKLDAIIDHFGVKFASDSRFSCHIWRDAPNTDAHNIPGNGFLGQFRAIPTESEINERFGGGLYHMLIKGPSRDPDARRVEIKTLASVRGLMIAGPVKAVTEEHPEGAGSLPASWQRALELFWEKRDQFSVWDRELLLDVYDKAGISEQEQIPFHEWLKQSEIMEVRQNPKVRFVFCLERLGKAYASLKHAELPPGWALGRQLRLREDSRDLKAGAVGIIRSLGVGACGDKNACIGCHASVEFDGGVYHLDLPELELYTLVADEACGTCFFDDDSYECQHCPDHPSHQARGPWDGTGYVEPARTYCIVGKYTESEAQRCIDGNWHDFEAYVFIKQAARDQAWRKDRARQDRPVVTATLDLAPDFAINDRGDDLD